MTAKEETSWEQSYYDATQLDETVLLESLQNEVSEDLQKATALEAKMHKISLDAKNYMVRRIKQQTENMIGILKQR